MNEHLPADLAARPGAPDLSLDEAIKRRLGKRSIVLVGLMGAGKSTVGRRLATRLDLRFTDADAEIETAAGMTIPDMFAMHGEAYFRDGERRVIARLLGEGPAVLATGGGAYMNPETRAADRARPASRCGCGPISTCSCAACASGTTGRCCRIRTRKEPCAG